MPSWIYAIIEKDVELCIYVGSTTGKYFCLRKGEHTRPSTTKSGRQPKLYGYVKEKGGWDKFKFDILKEYETIDKIELRINEKKYIEQLKPTCNSIKPIQTKEEMLERKRGDQKKYRKNHPEYLKKHKMRQSQIDYTIKRCSTKIECPCGGTYTLQNKTNHFSRNIHKKYETEKTKIEDNKEITQA